MAPSTRSRGRAVGPASSSPPLVYVALGASETAGLGTDVPARDSFPQQRAAKLGHDAILYNLGIAGESTARAEVDELPAALAAAPRVVTVFFSVDDLVQGVSPADFELHLNRIVGALRAAGSARILVATAPPVDQLPAAAACEQGLSGCPLKGAQLPPPATVRLLIDAYDQAIHRVAAAHGGLLVDLSPADLAVSQHPEYVAADGFHPSSAGAAALADAFYAVLGAAP